MSKGIATEEVIDRSHLSNRQTIILSISRRLAALSSDSRCGRWFVPEPVSSISITTFHCRCLAYFLRACICIGRVY